MISGKLNYDHKYAKTSTYINLELYVIYVTVRYIT